MVNPCPTCGSINRALRDEITRLDQENHNLRMAAISHGGWQFRTGMIVAFVISWVVIYVCSFLK